MADNSRLDKVRYPCLSLAVLLLVGFAWVQPPAPASAQTDGRVLPPAPFDAVITVDSAPVRAVATESDNYYTLGELVRNQVVRVGVVGPAGWFRIEPPAGIFSVLPRERVELNADRTEATVSIDQTVLMAWNPQSGGQSFTPQRVLFSGTRLSVHRVTDDEVIVVPPAGVTVFIRANIARALAPGERPPAPIATPGTTPGTPGSTPGAPGTTPGTRPAPDAGAPPAGTTPGAAATEPRMPAPSQTITIRGDDHFEFGGRIYPNEVADVLFRQLAAGGTDRDLTFRTYRDVPFRSVQRMVELARQHGLQRVSLQSIGQATPARPDAGRPTTPPDTTDPTTPRTTEQPADTDPPARPDARPAFSGIAATVRAAVTRFREAEEQPLAERPITDLLSIFEALAEDSGLQEPDRQLVAAHLADLRRLRIAQEALASIEAARSKIDDAADEEPRFRPDDTPPVYDLTGILVPSRLFDGRTRPQLLRLRDVETDATLGYIRPEALDSPADLLGKTVGIIGRIDPPHPELGIRLLRIQRIDRIDP